MLYIIAILTAIIAYLIGSVSGAILISKRVDGDDIRTKGSKNAGTTNMLRIYGKKAAVFTLLIDVLKGVIAVLIGIAVDYFVADFLMVSNLMLTDSQGGFLIGNIRYIASIFVMLGHDFPIYFGFKGGKGVATGLGAVLAIDYKVALIVLVAALLIMVITRYVSLGSVAAAVIYPCVAAAFMAGSGEFNAVYLICAVILAVLIIAKHHTNIQRLLNGTENKLFSKKDKS